MSDKRRKKMVDRLEPKFLCWTWVSYVIFESCLIKVFFNHLSGLISPNSLCHELNLGSPFIAQISVLNTNNYK